MCETNRFSEALATFYEASHDYGDIGDESFYHPLKLLLRRRLLSERNVLPEG